MAGKLSPEEKEKRAEQNRIKLFLSSIFARKHRHIYLDRNNPFEMICTTIPPEDVFPSSRSIDQVIHIVKSKHVNLWDAWNTLLPLDEFSAICIYMSGLNSIRKVCQNDHEKIKNTWLIDPASSCRYRIKIAKKGKRDVEEIVPIIQPISTGIIKELTNEVQGVINSFKQCHETAVLDIEYIPRVANSVRMIDPSKAIPSAKGVKLPFADGFNTISISEYLRKTEGDTVQVHLGRHGRILYYYCERDDDQAHVVSVIPKQIYYCINM